MTSRFGLDPKALQRGADTAPPMSPICNPCQEPDHGRCPTVLAENGIIDSDYRCPCHHRDPDGHGAAFEANQESFRYVDRDDLQGGSHFGRTDWDSEGRQAWDSVGGVFDW